MNTEERPYRLKSAAIAICLGLLARGELLADASVYTISIPAGETNEFTQAQIDAINSGDYDVLAKRGEGCLVGGSSGRATERPCCYTTARA